MENNAVVVFSSPRVVILEDREIPVPRKNELLIKTRMTLISTGTELTILTKDFPDDVDYVNYAKFPFYPGYNNLGEVVEVGEGVDRSWIGKRVASYGGHAQFVVSSPERVHTIERDISDDEAVFFTIAEIVLNGIRKGNVKLGENAVVYGLGLLGQLAVRFLRKSGARPVFAVDIADQRIEKLPEDPSIIPINSKSEDVLSTIKKFTHGRMADVVFELTGNASLIPQELKSLRKQGRFVLLSSPRGKTTMDFREYISIPGYTIIGAHNSTHPIYETYADPWTRGRNIELFFDLVEKKEIDVKSLITDKFHYTHCTEAYQILLEDRATAMGVIFDWT